MKHLNVLHQVHQLCKKLSVMRFQQGIVQGIKQGIAQGVEQGKQDLISKMKKSGMSDEQIQKILAIN